MKIKVEKLKTINITVVVAFVAIILISYGCAGLVGQQRSTYKDVASRLYKDVPQGIIKTKGVKIEAVDGSFVLRSGESFETPSSNTHLWWQDSPPTPDSFELCKIAKRKQSPCTEVIVTVPGKKKPLYGYLNFSKMHPHSKGPGSRSYLIEIPERYVDEASDGRVSLVYEWVSTANIIHRKNRRLTVEDTRQTGWVLWLSDAPF